MKRFVKRLRIIGVAAIFVVLLMCSLPAGAHLGTDTGDSSDAEEVTGEDLVRMSPDVDIISFSLKEKVIAANAQRGKKIDFGTTVENSIVGDCWVAWYNNARVNGTAGVIILVSTIPDSAKNYDFTNYANIILERSDRGDRTKLDNFIKNPESRNAYLLDCIKKIKDAQKKS